MYLLTHLLVTNGKASIIQRFAGVVAHCADTVKKEPSDADQYEVPMQRSHSMVAMVACVVQIYHLPTDPFEKNNIASSAEGRTQRSKMHATVMGAGVSCECFQC